MTNSTPTKLAVITGASSGIGYELARQFAQNGFRLIIASASTDIIQAAKDLRKEGAELDYIQADLATPEGVEKLWKKVQSKGEALGAIAINAGVGVGGHFVDTSIEEEINMINLNIVGTTYLAKLALQDMVERGEGRILFTASIASTMSGPFEAVYAATKAYVLSLADAIRTEVDDTDITITALMPGATDTNFFHRAGMDNTKVGQDKKDDPADVAKQGFEALMKGESHVVAASFKSKMMGYMNEVMPERLKSAYHRKLSEPLTDKAKRNQ